MKTIKLSVLFSAILLMLTITSCKKDKYQPVGDYGNANTTSSNTINATNFTEISNDGTNWEYHSQLTWGVITQDIMDNGIIVGYMKVGSEWVALPFGQDEDTYSFNYNFSIETGKINVYIQGWSTFGVSSSNWNGITFRFVAISQEGRMSHPNIDLTNYEEVKMTYDLEE